MRRRGGAAGLRPAQGRGRPKLGSAKGADETLQEFFRLCDAGGETCAFSAGDPARRYARLAERLLREPVEFPGGQGGTFLVGYPNSIEGGASACVDGYVNRYLLTSAVPPAGTVCRPDVAPFAAAAPAATRQTPEASARSMLIAPLVRRLLDR